MNRRLSGNNLFDGETGHTLFFKSCNSFQQCADGFIAEGRLFVVTGDVVDRVWGVMFFRRQNNELEVLAPAKINLFLEITDKRPDGFHELDMLMVPIALYDTLTFKLRRDDKITLSSSCAVGNKIALPAAPDNLVTRAIKLLRQRMETGSSVTMSGIDIRLFKRIPAAAGLGGGSSDAAAALVAANHLWQAGLSTVELADQKCGTKHHNHRY